MTPEERNLIIALFDRLATLEDAQRDSEAERLIRDGLRQAPNAVYALVQTVLVQDEALQQANARIQALEAAQAQAAPAGDTSFLGSMRGALFGGREGRGSVPSVRPGGVSPAWNAGAPPAMPPGPMGGPPPGHVPGYGAPPPAAGGSFLGTAAAAAAGVIGGSLLMSGIRNAMAGHGDGGHRAFEPQGGSPWGGGSGSGGGGELSREAGLDDIGRGSGRSRFAGDEGRGYGITDASYDTQQYDAQNDVSDDDGGGFDLGGSDDQ